MRSDRYDQGMKILAEIGGTSGDIVSESLKAIEELAPGLSQSIVEFPYGDIYSRPGLDLKLREIAAISALSVIGSKPQLIDHILTGLNLGLTQEEIREIIVQIIIFAGFPAALKALTTAREAFELWDENIQK